MSGGYFSASDSFRFWFLLFLFWVFVFVCFPSSRTKDSTPKPGESLEASTGPQKLPGTTSGPRRTFSQFPYLRLESKCGHSHLVLSKYLKVNSACRHFICSMTAFAPSGPEVVSLIKSGELREWVLTSRCLKCLEMVCVFFRNCEGNLNVWRLYIFQCFAY